MPEGARGIRARILLSGLVDEWITVLAPKVIGSRRIGKAVTIPRASVLPDGVEVAG